MAPSTRSPIRPLAAAPKVCRELTNVRTRFAPSPSGYLHLGHAFSALETWKAAGREPENFILRIEDIDTTRCRPEFEEAIYEDLSWLGLSWPEPVVRQSERFAEYATALEVLKDLGVVYPCFCTRKEIQEEIARSADAPHGPDGALYPGNCRGLSAIDREEKLNGGFPHAWRLDVGAAVAKIGPGPLTWFDRRLGKQDADVFLLGDVVIARKDIGTSYHLAVVVDDAAQEIELVTRGEDLLHASHVHRLLQALLDLPVPEWNHHRLINDDAGKRLAKRSGSQAIRAFRDQGMGPADVIEILAATDHLPVGTAGIPGSVARSQRL
jgi:glutamyl-Q tRNA(Asp) synthetase